MIQGISVRVRCKKSA